MVKIFWKKNLSIHSFIIFIRQKHIQKFFKVFEHFTFYEKRWYKFEPNNSNYFSAKYIIFNVVIFTLHQVIIIFCPLSTLHQYNLLHVHSLFYFLLSPLIHLCILISESTILRLTSQHPKTYYNTVSLTAVL